MTKVSVIIPTYNRAHYVGDAIRSALNQEISDLEVIVVDDGSTDDTLDVVNRITDPRVSYVYQQNSGATSAFNRGIAESKGSYINVLGSDDSLLPGGLVPLADELDRHPHLGAISGGFNDVDETGKFVRNAHPWTSFPQLDTKTWLFWCPSILQASLIRRTWVDAIGGFDPAVKCAQDWDFGLRLAHAGCEMSWINRTVFNYRLHRNQISRDASTIRNDYRIVLDKFFAQDDLPSSLSALRDAAYAQAFIKGAIRAFEAKQCEDGRDDLERAIELAPQLLDNRAQKIFNFIVGWANDAKAVDSTQFINLVFANLPDSATVLKQRRQEALAAISMAIVFTAYEKRDWPSVRRALVQGILLDRSWLRNRGVVSIGMKAFLGFRATA